MITAVIFVSADAPQSHVDRCLNHCITHAYEITTVVRGDWNEVTRMRASGEAQVVVIARWDHLDPERLPRVELATVAALPPNTDPPGRARSRTRRPQNARWAGSPRSTS